MFGKKQEVVKSFGVNELTKDLGKSIEGRNAQGHLEAVRQKNAEKELMSIDARRLREMQSMTTPEVQEQIQQLIDTKVRLHSNNLSDKMQEFKWLTKGAVNPLSLLTVFPAIIGAGMSVGAGLSALREKIRLAQADRKYLVKQ